MRMDEENELSKREYKDQPPFVIFVDNKAYADCFRSS